MTRAIILSAREERMLHGNALEVRAVDGASPRIVGYAAVFNQESEVLNTWLGRFRETIKPGAFAKTIADGGDVRALLNHDANWVLGRTKNNTLQLREDSHGLWMEVTPPDTNWARDLLTTMRRGDMDQASFGFQTVQSDWGRTKDADGKEVDLHILKSARLLDVSVVTYPAYPQAELSVRSLLTGAGLDADGLTRVILRAQRGLPLERADVTLLQATIDHLRSYLPVLEVTAEPAPSAAHSEQAEDPSEPVPPAAHSVEVNWSRLERLEQLISGVSK